MSNSLDIAQQLSWAIAARENPLSFFDTRSAAQLTLQGSRAVQDVSAVEAVSSVARDIDLHTIVSQLHHLNEFLNSVTDWLQQHSTNSIRGIDQYVPDFSAGTTQSFDSFYWRHRHRRMRCFVGEYFYHIKTWISTNTDWSFISEQDPLQPGDALILSVPFCDTGNQRLDYAETMSVCDRLEIPVLIDACYFTISSGIDIDLNYHSIDTVAFSLSKAFPVAHLRIGVRYTRDTVFDGQKLHNTINYNNIFSAYVGKKLIDNFKSDYIHSVYQEKQKQVCDCLGLTPSSSVLFAVGDSDWNQYSRQNLLQSYQLDFDPQLFVNRISLTGVYDNWDIFKAVTA